MSLKVHLDFNIDLQTTGFIELLQLAQAHAYNKQLVFARHIK